MSEGIGMSIGMSMGMGGRFGWVGAYTCVCMHLATMAFCDFRDGVGIAR
jgi:hypothetical protein